MPPSHPSSARSHSLRASARSSSASSASESSASDSDAGTSYDDDSLSSSDSDAAPSHDRPRQERRMQESGSRRGLVHGEAASSALSALHRRPASAAAAGGGGGHASSALAAVAATSTAAKPAAVGHLPLHTLNSSLSHSQSQATATPVSPLSSLLDLSSSSSSLVCTPVPCTVHPLQRVPLTYLSAPAGSLPIPSPAPRPFERVWLEVEFPQPSVDEGEEEEEGMGLRYVTLRNYYTARITIRQLLPATDNHPTSSASPSSSSSPRMVWRTVLHRHPLMLHPHEEGEAQRWVTIDVSTSFNDKFDPRRLQRFRVEMYQPSPNWNTFHVEEVQFWRVGRPHAASSPNPNTARGTAVPRPLSATRRQGSASRLQDNEASRLGRRSSLKSTAAAAQRSSTGATSPSSSSLDQLLQSYIDSTPPSSSSSSLSLSRSPSLQARVQAVLASMAPTA